MIGTVPLAVRASRPVTVMVSELALASVLVWLR
jgi:hypothetical protein